MRKSSIVVFILALAFSSVYGQKWDYKKGGDAFDGEYKASSVIGKGEEFPYENPVFVVNYFPNKGNLNVYISDAGYAGCSDKKVKVNFQKEDDIYTFNATTGGNEENWFLSQGDDITIRELLEKMTRFITLNVRISSECGKNDLKFSLSGSNEAINYVLPDGYFSNEEQEQEISERDQGMSYSDSVKERNQLIEIAQSYLLTNSPSEALGKLKEAKKFVPERLPSSERKVDSLIEAVKLKLDDRTDY